MCEGVRGRGGGMGLEEHSPIWNVNTHIDHFVEVVSKGHTHKGVPAASHKVNLIQYLPNKI